MVRFRLILLLPAIAPVVGCIELQVALEGAIRDMNRDGHLDRDNGDGSADGPGTDVPVATLTVSNPTPQVNEEVLLTCLVTNDVSGPLTYEFQPGDGRLFSDPRLGTASFFVEQADVGTAFVFTCTAANENGTSEPSNEQLITPSQ